MSNRHFSNSSYFMQDQVRGKVRSFMGETWFSSPAGALCSLIAFVAAISIVGGMGTAQAAESIHVLSGWWR